MATWEDFKNSIRVSEGNIPHMYLDSVGAVTVGVGAMLPSAAAASALGFVDRKSGKPATKEAIQADYASVAAQPKNLRADAYKKFTALDLPSDVIESLLDSKIADAKNELAVRFPKIGTYPLAAQIALTDMAFNLGTTGLVSKFPSFTKAVLAGDWSKAADESNRPQLSLARNALVKGWLNEAAAEIAKAASKAKP